MAKKESIISYPGLLLDLAEKELPVIEVPLKKGFDYAEIVLMGDFHIGSDGFSEHQLLAYIEWIKANPEVRVILMGDLMEIGDLSGFLEAQKDNFKAQCDKVIEYLDPIKDQIIIWLEGNHEERYAREVKGAVNLSRYLALELGINRKIILPGPQRGQIAVIKVANGLKTMFYPIYVIHGSTGAIANSSTQLKRMAYSNKLALVAHGHIHRIFHENYIYRSVTQIGDRFYESVFEQHWLTTGSFTKYPGYAEAKSMPMTKIGAPIVRFYLRNKPAIQPVEGWTEYGIGQGGAETTSEDLPEKVRRPCPPCPRCQGSNIISRGLEWCCKDCHRRWVKEVKRKEVNE